MAQAPDRGQEVAELALRIRMSEKRGETDQVADRMGLSYDAFSARLRNRVVFLADEIRQLISPVPDFRIAAWLLRDSRSLRRIVGVWTTLSCLWPKACAIRSCMC